jgi:hypothetical protein
MTHKVKRETSRATFGTTIINITGVDELDMRT